MSKSSKGLRKAGIASVAVSLTLGAGVLGAGAANAVEDFSFDRIGGDNRYATSALIADEYDETNTDVILANGEPGSYADALSANYLAGVVDEPILLTRDDRTPDEVLAQLEEDGVENITVVGGAGVVSEEQVAALEAEGYDVTRISGSDRFLTNADVIGEGGQAVGGIGIIATGFNFPDALAAGPISYQGHPLGLSTKDEIDQEVIDALKAAGVNKVVIMGGVSAVSAAVEAQLAENDIDVIERFSGSNRSETSQLAAEWAVANAGLTNTHVGVASGYTEGYGADALAGGPLEGKEKAPMLITNNVDRPGFVLDYLEDHANTLETGHIYGGTAAISAAAQAEMEEAASSVSGNQDFTVTPQDEATISLDETNPSRQYTVSGLDNATEYDIALVDADDVTVGANGVVSFADADNSNEYETGAVAGAHISVINGSATTGTPDGAEVNPVNGSISFTVSGTAYSSVVPVVWVDTEDDGDIELGAGADNTPSEDFGVGGATHFLPAESALGTLGSDAEVVEIFDNGDGTRSVVLQVISATTTAGGDAQNLAAGDYVMVNLDANDSYYVVAGEPGDAATTYGAANQELFADFLAQMSVGDQFDQDTDYNDRPAFVSTFVLEDLDPEAPAVDNVVDDGGVNELAAADVDANQVSIDVSNLDDEVDSVTVYYIEDADGDDDSLTTFSATTFESETFTAADDTDAATDDVWEVTLTGLAEDTSYDAYVTQTAAGEESSRSTGFEFTTDVVTETVRPTITNTERTVDGGVGGVLITAAGDSDDTIVLDFSEAMSATLGDTAATYFRLTDGTDTFQVTCDADATNDDTTDGCDLQNGPGSTDADDQLEIDLGDADVTITRIAGTGALDVATETVTVNLLSPAFDDAAGNQVDLAASSDVTVDDE